ncbi:hypothetical protein EDD21DRAFT_213404 [Dissophora ornata]|nr:hypothetical protein EDD21DRAFT_213404 [Dissophora ornata]
MAKRKAAARKPKQTVHQCQSGSSSKHTSASPSVVSSPSPQPQDLVQRRRKGIPVRSPSQGDPSKGIVFAFRIQNDSDLSMAVDILSYDQVPDNSATTTSTESTPATTVEATARVATIAAKAGARKSNVLQYTAESTVVSPNLKVSGEHWSNDPSLYQSSNVMDLNRNVLILHSRKPQDSSASSPSSPLFHPYRRLSVPSRSLSLSQPSTPPLTDSGSSSSASSSPSSSASSPTLFHPSAGGGKGVVGCEGDLCSLDSLSSPSVSVLDAMRSQPPRMLSVRGLGTGGRRMQVYLV